MAIAIDLSGQTAWVTGGASGIGAGVVQTLVAAGARVVSLDRSHVPSADDGSVIRVPLDVRDSETEGHARRVVQYLELVAEELGVPASERAVLLRGALLHDVGKIGVPDEVLRKRGPLSTAARERPKAVLTESSRLARFNMGGS